MRLGNLLDDESEQRLSNDKINKLAIKMIELGDYRCDRTKFTDVAFNLLARSPDLTHTQMSVIRLAVDKLWDAYRALYDRHEVTKLL